MIFFYFRTYINSHLISILITIYLVTLLVHEMVGLFNSSEKGLIVTLFCIIGILAIRWVYSGHLPLSNLLEL